jgi:hypothetical protein
MASETPPSGYFNVHKNKDSREKDGRTTFVSPSDSIASTDGHAMVASFRHEQSGKSVFFKAFISSLTETYNCDWTEENIFGRTDPSRLFRQTTRRISLGLKVPAESFSEAYDNLGRVSMLEQFLYPNYTPVGLHKTISQGPYVRMKVMNLIAKAGTQAAGDATTGEAKDATSKASAASYGSYKSTPDAAHGLLGVITSLTVNHNLENSDVTTFAKDGNTVLPGLIELNVDFAVIHEKRLGWNKTDFNDGVFPYGVTLMSDADAEVAADKVKEEIAARHRPKVKPAENLPSQASLDAQARYGKAIPGAVSRLAKDLEFLAKMKEKMSTGKLSPKEAANYNYINSAVNGAKSSWTSSQQTGNVEFMLSGLTGLTSWESKAAALLGSGPTSAELTSYDLSAFNL